MRDKSGRSVSKSVINIKKPDTSKTWILVGQRTKAKLLEYRNGSKKLVLIKGFVNPAGKIQNRNLVSDKPGRSFSKVVKGVRHAMPRSEEAHEHALTAFAKELAEVMEKGLAKSSCDKLVLVGEPHCVGKLKASFSPKARKKIKAVIDSDLFRLSNEKLQSKLQPILR